MDNPVDSVVVQEPRRCAHAVGSAYYIVWVCVLLLVQGAGSPYYVLYVLLFILYNTVLFISQPCMY